MVEASPPCATASRRDIAAGTARGARGADRPFRGTARTARLLPSAVARCCEPSHPARSSDQAGLEPPRGAHAARRSQRAREAAPLRIRRSSRLIPFTFVIVCTPFAFCATVVTVRSIFAAWLVRPAAGRIELSGGWNEVQDVAG